MRVYIGIDAGWESMRYEVRNVKKERIETGRDRGDPRGVGTILKEVRASKGGPSGVRIGGRKCIGWTRREENGNGQLSLSCGALFHPRDIEEHESVKGDSVHC